MYCSRCGNKIEDNARFCDNCGALIAGHSETGYENKSNTETSWESQENSLVHKIKKICDGLELSGFQKMLCIIAMISAICALIRITGAFVSWLKVIAAIILVISCIKKKEYKAKLPAVAFSIFAFSFLILDFEAIFGVVHIQYTFWGIMERILLYGMSVVYWFMVSGKFAKKQIASSIIAVGCSIVCIYAFIKVFASMGDSFGKVINYLAQLSFFFDYSLMIYADGETLPFIKELFTSHKSVTDNTSHEAVSDKYCSKCGNSLSMQAVFCEKCGARVEMEIVKNDELAEHKKSEVNESYRQITENKEICSNREEGFFYEKTNTVIPTVKSARESDGMLSEQGQIHNDSSDVRDSIKNVKEEPVEESEIIDSKVKEISGKNPVCPECGVFLEEEGVFCGNCGAKIVSKFRAEEQDSMTGDLLGSQSVFREFIGFNEFIIDEKISAFKFANSYKIYDLNGTIIGAVQQGDVSAGAKATRVLLGGKTKTFQKFELSLLSASGRKLGSIYRDGGALATIYVDSADGKHLTEMKLRFGAFKDTSDRVVCKLGIAGLTKYLIKDENGNILAEIAHRWNGAKSLFTTADKYHISISPDLIGDRRQIIVSIAVACDMLSGDC